MSNITCGNYLEITFIVNLKKIRSKIFSTIFFSKNMLSIYTYLKALLANIWKFINNQHYDFNEFDININNHLCFYVKFIIQRHIILESRFLFTKTTIFKTKKHNLEILLTIFWKTILFIE